LLKEIVIAIQAYFQAHQFIQKNKLWKWILIPGIIYSLFFVISIYYFGQSATQVIEWLSLKIGLKNWVQHLQSSVIGFLFVLGGSILWLILMFFYFSLFKYIWLIIGSPVFAFLSEKTQSIIDGKDYPFSFSQFLKDIKRGIQVAIRNTLWQTVYTITIVLLSLIPLFGWVTPLVALLVECYYYGFSMLDYSMERNKQSMQESITFIGNHKGLAIGNGIVFYMMHLIPIVGWILAPAYSVVAATLSINNIDKSS
jgi:CysZ protein